MSDNLDIKEILSKAYRDKRFAAKFFFPERFYRPFDPIHQEIFDLIHNDDSQLKAIAAPRGVGKTSIINLLLPSLAILFQETNYIVNVSATHSLATQQAENLKYELTTNPVIREIYGDVKTDSFSKEQWIVRVGGPPEVGGQEICIMPRGAGQQIRGLLFRNHRPGLIVVDDLEDPEHMDSEDQRRKKKEWFFADLMNSIDRGRKDWRIIVLGTVLHQDSLLVNLLENSRWTSKSLEICDDQLRSNAPNFISDEDVRELYESMKASGELDVFYREYRNLPFASGADAAFPQSVFQYYQESELNLDANPDVETMVIVDPAKTAKMESADSAVVGVGANMRNNSIYVRDVVAGKFHADEIIRETVDMVVRLNARVLGVEVTSLHEFITYPIKNELARRGVHVEFIELHARGGAQEKGKVMRVRSLIPFYRKGMVFHNPRVSAPLEAQLLSFPRPKRWDIMDALGYVVEMLERGQRYMTDIPGEREFEDSMDPRIIEAEYDDLMDGYESPITDFRVI